MAVPTKSVTTDDFVKLCRVDAACFFLSFLVRYMVRQWDVLTRLEVFTQLVAFWVSSSDSCHGLTLAVVVPSTTSLWQDLRRAFMLS